MGKGKIHRKICTDCLKEFENAGLGNCPWCGSTSWNFVDDNGGIVIPYLDYLRQKRDREARMTALIQKFHPETTGRIR